MRGHIQSWKEKDFQPRILSTTKLSFKTEGQINIFSEKQKLRKTVSSRPAQQDSKGSPSGQNERTLNNNLNPHEDIRTTNKNNYIGNTK